MSNPEGIAIDNGSRLLTSEGGHTSIREANAIKNGVCSGGAVWRRTGSPPGRCGRAALIVAIAVGVLALLGFFGGGARAQKKNKGGSDIPPTTMQNGTKTKNYTFGGLDIDGKLKTPQLLYFLNRMKSEFDSTTPGKRSFVPELKRSTDEM